MASQSSGGGGGSSKGYRPPPKSKPRTAHGRATPRKPPTRTGLEAPNKRLTERGVEKQTTEKARRDYSRGVAGSKNTESKSPVKPVTKKPVEMPAIVRNGVRREFTMSKEEIDRVGKKEAQRRYEAWKRKWTT